MTTSRLGRLTLAALAALSLTACSDDASGPKSPTPGHARITLAAEGDDTTMNVDAYFGKEWDESEENRVFAIASGAESETMTIVMARRDTVRPGIGEIAVADLTGEEEVPDDELQVALILADETTLGVFAGKSGSVRVTRSSAQSLAGTIDMVVEGLIWIEGSTTPAEVTMEVTGTYNASAAPTGVPTSALEARVSDLRVRDLRVHGLKVSR